MARGMVVNEPVVSQAATEEYLQGHARVFVSEPPRPGRYLYRPGHPKASALGFVHADDLGDDVPQEPELALSAPIISGRCHEGVRALDGTDIGSRAKRREYMKARNLADADDFKQTWATAQERRASGYEAPEERRERREQIGRALYNPEHKGRGHHPDIDD